MSVFIIKCSETIEYELPVEAETEQHAKEIFYSNLSSGLDEYITGTDFIIESIDKGH